MKSNSVDVLIYIQDKVKPEIIANAAANIAELAGVIKASINPKVKHLLAVEYDPSHITGNAILDVVRENGCSASLVGM